VKAVSAAMLANKVEWVANKADAVDNRVELAANRVDVVARKVEKNQTFQIRAQAVNLVEAVIMSDR
jgi:hypothetical protein